MEKPRPDILYGYQLAGRIDQAQMACEHGATSYLGGALRCITDCFRAVHTYLLGTGQVGRVCDYLNEV